MIIQQLNRQDAEKIQVMVKNVDGGGSITTGMGATLVGSGASIDGVSATKALIANARGFIGVAAYDIPINGYGLVTAWGYAQSVMISNVGSSITVTAGDLLLPSTVAGTFFSGQTPAGMSTLFYKYVFAATTVPVDLSNAAQAYVAGIVRAV